MLWLNERDLDIRCVRLRPYLLGNRTLLDIQQVIPLPEAAEYHVHLRKKEAEKRLAKGAIPWNGEFYVSFGHDPQGRNWDDAVKYGFISAGGGSWYTQTLNMLTEGARIWVNVPGVGYAGVGIVEETAKQINEFVVRDNDGRQIPIHRAALKSPSIGINANDPERAEHVVRIRWLKTFGLDDAISERGFFGNQNTVARPTSPKWDYTIQVLKERLGIS